VVGELGLGGASFPSPFAAAPGDPVIVEVTFPGSPSRTVLEATVVNSAQRGGVIHVRFTALDLQTELVLARWLDGVGESSP